MPTIKFNSLLFALLLLATGLFGQKGSSENTLQLRSGSISLSANADIYFDKRTQHSSTEYRYIQFFKIPTAHQLVDLEKHGIRCLQYLTQQTYIASISTTGILPADLQNNIRSIVPINPADKISPSLLDFLKEENTFGEKQNITFLLQHYSDFPSEKIISLLREQSISILEQQPEVQAITVSANKSQLMEIASWPMIANLENTITEISPEDEFGQSHHRSNLLNSSWNSSMHFNGAGVHIAIGEDGFIGPHIDLKNRTVQADLIGDQVGTHGEMVAGILTGAGNLNPANRGIADGATLHVLREFESVKQAVSLYEDHNVVITNTAYSDGCNRGYTTLAQQADNQSDQIPAIIHVFSAGNAGIDDCEYGAGNGWGNITGGVKAGKNVLAVANLNSDGNRVSSSSRGPSNDGRIKPDIAAFGEGQIGLSPNNEYQIGSGTSAAAPVISGVLAQLYQFYREEHINTNPSSALLKACLLNSADDLGNPGPDYSFGWGKVNAFNAFKTLEEERWIKGISSQNSIDSFSITVPSNTKEVRVMIYWHDKAASPISPKSLVNDIDLSIAAPDGTIHQPWILDNTPNVSLLEMPATKGGDHLNNVEQVVIQNPVEGTYNLLVHGWEIPFTQQEYYIVYQYASDELSLSYPDGGESFAPADQVSIHWEAINNNGEFELEYSIDDGATWIAIATVAADLRQFSWTVPDLASGATRVRIRRGSQTATSTQSFSIYNTPSGFSIEQVCPTFVRLSWDNLEGAESYTIYQLGERYMDSVATTTNTIIDLPILNPTLAHWFAIQATSTEGANSKRSLAISTEVGLMNCIPAHDIALAAITNPSNSSLSDCFNQSVPVNINLRNTGSEIQNNIPLYYQYNNEPVVAGILNSSIPSGVTVNYVFDIPINTIGIGLQTLKVWTGLIADEASYNDSLSFRFEIIPSVVNTLPFFENFDDFENCSSSTSCTESCLLQNDWSNIANDRDQIDWRINNGRTPSAQTGPSSDQNTEIDAGQYLYLEAGAGCYQQRGELNSPCIDLGNAVVPTLSFWYHMYGATMGSLHIDLFDGMQWHYNISLALSGDQGNEWKKATIDLTAFANQLVVLRFRGKTGNNFLTDIAIDNVAIYDASSPPIAEFTATKRQGCADEVITFRDNSFNEGISWSWTFEPNTVTFLENTNAQSQYPIVQFGETGLYSITLSTTNAFGTSEKQQADYILISDGLALPYLQNFDGPSFPPQHWQSENRDNLISWDRFNVIGKDNTWNQAASMNNFSYNRPDEEDVLQAPIINLNNANSPLLRFDYSYVSFSDNFSDQLKVLLSTDCGNHFEFVLFEKSGADLATSDNQKKAWAPRKSIDWETAIIDLSAYVGQSISLQFVNTCQFGNNLYLDNVGIYEAGDFPVTNFETEAMTVCIGETLTFQNTTTGNDDGTYFWSFGENNLPPIADTEGSHTVTFPETGFHPITLIATNDLGADIETINVEVIDEPTAAFNSEQNGQNGLEVQFSNNSLYGTSYLWDFGDGTTSTEANPTYVYNSAGNYEVRLLVSNDCGSQEESQFIIISNTHQPLSTFELSLFPSPATDWFIIQTKNNSLSNLHYRILSVSGKLYSEADISVTTGTQLHQVDISHLAAGVYFLHFEMGGVVHNRKLIVL